MLLFFNLGGHIIIIIIIIITINTLTCSFFLFFSFLYVFFVLSFLHKMPKCFCSIKKNVRPYFVLFTCHLILNLNCMHMYVYK